MFEVWSWLVLWAGIYIYIYTGIHLELQLWRPVLPPFATSDPALISVLPQITLLDAPGDGVCGLGAVPFGSVPFSSVDSWRTNASESRWSILTDLSSVRDPPGSTLMTALFLAHHSSTLCFSLHTTFVSRFDLQENNTPSPGPFWSFDWQVLWSSPVE